MRMDLKFITILIMSCFYMNVGVKHFVEPEWFLQIMPPNFPHHYLAVYWSGFFELLFGFLLSFLFLPKQIVRGFIDNEEKVKMLFSGLITGSVPAVWLHIN